jgi:hypothetical protein
MAGDRVDERAVVQGRGRHIPLGLVFGVVLVFLFGAPLAMFNPDWARVFPFVLLFGICLGASWRRLSPIALSPVFYFAGYLAILAILGVLLSNLLVGSGGTGGVDVALEPSIAVEAANVMLVGASITLLGGAASRGRRTRRDILNVFDLGDIARYAGWFLLFGTVELLALVGYLGIDQLLQRSERLVGRGGSGLESVIAMAAVASVVVVGIAFFTRRGFARVYALLLLMAFLAYFVSMGTRRLALVPLLLLMAYVISKRGKVGLVTVVVTGAIALLLLPLPLYFRGQWAHGLLPYIASLSAFQITPAVLAESFNNFLAGFKITAMTGLLQPAIPSDVLWISLNPVQGESAGWYQVSQSLRINRYTPYSAVGELINYGPVIFVAMFAALGLTLGLIQRSNDKLLADPIGRFVAIIALGLVFIFVIQSTQYNLRSDLRYVYLALAAQIVGLAVMAIRDRLAKRDEFISPRQR